jgi:hypothetical protein
LSNVKVSGAPLVFAFCLGGGLRRRAEAAGAEGARGVWHAS